MKPIAPPRDYGEARGLKKGPWSAGEDRILIEYVRVHGEGNWNAVQRSTPLQRCGKSCRLRWANHLRPNLKKGSFSPDEERLIIDLHSSLGNKWARISAHLPGRTDNEVKNYWNTRVKRRLRQGLPLYPNSHLPTPLPPPPPPTPPLPHLKTPPSFLDPAFLPFPAPFFAFSQPSMRIQPSSFLLGPNSDPPGLGLGFPSMLELPSNQFRPESVTDDEEFIDEAKFNPNVCEFRSDNSGLLDALLQEAQSRAAAAANSLKKDCLDGDGDRWDSIFGNPSTGGDKGAAKMEDSEDHTCYTNDDLSSILNLIRNEGGDASAGKSSNISDHNATAGLDDTEWLNGSGAWDNLPRIC